MYNKKQICCIFLYFYLEISDCGSKCGQIRKKYAKSPTTPSRVWNSRKKYDAKNQSCIIGTHVLRPYRIIYRKYFKLSKLHLKFNILILVIRWTLSISLLIFDNYLCSLQYFVYEISLLSGIITTQLLSWNKHSK